MQKDKLNKKVLVKSVSTEILICVIAAAVIGIGLVVGVIKGSDLLGKVMLTLLTLFIAGLFLLNSINAVTAGNKLGIAAAIMLVISALLVVVLIWGANLLGDFYDTYGRMTVLVAMVSILLDLIVGNYIVLGKRLIIIQILQYLSFAYVELVVSFMIFGNNALVSAALIPILISAIIVTFTLYIVLKVKQKNMAQAEVENRVNGNGDEFVTITKVEYEELKAAAEKLKELTANSDPSDAN